MSVVSGSERAIPVRMKLLVLCLGVCLLVGGCTSGKGSAVNTSSAAVSTSVSASPSVATTGPNVQPGAKPPVMLEAAKVHDQLGAMAFAAYVLQAVSWAYSTTDAHVLDAVYASDCQPCKLQRDAIVAVAAKNEHFVGGHLRALSLQSVKDREHGADEAFDIAVDVEALRVVNQQGQTVEGPYPHETPTIRYLFKWTDTGWRVVHSGLVKP